MHITIRHETRYTYDGPVPHAVQRLALTPPEFPGQVIQSWAIDAPGIEDAPRYRDGYGNIVHLCSQSGFEGEMAIVAHGVAETSDNNGITGRLANEPPPRIFQRRTDLSDLSDDMQALADDIAAQTADDVERMHRLMAHLYSGMNFDPQVTNSRTLGSQAFAAGQGVCQDFTHIFIAVARHLDLPARYITGYLLLEDEVRAEAQHAWAEIWIKVLGWVGFDATNNVCPTERYVRLCCGLDADSAAPVRGLRLGHGREALSVDVDVQQSNQ